MFAYGFDFAEIIAYEINLAVSLIVFKKKRLNVLKIFLGDFIFFKKHADSEELELFFHHDLWKILKVKQLSLQMLII